MIDLRILGGMDLSASGGEASDPAGLLSQPKPTALFVYLLIARPGGLVRRDAVAAMLWPESDQRRARGALSQTLYVIRRHLGSSAVITRGTEDIGIAADAVRCDALEFRRLFDQGLHEKALALYSGELLPSFYLTETPAFEHWLETERARLRRSAVKAAWSVADASEAAGDAAKAAQWSRWAARTVPDDEAVLRRMLEMHDRLGDRAGALAEFGRYRKRLMAELELEPESETSALAAAIAAAGKRGEGPAVPTHEMAPGAEATAPDRRARAARFSWLAGVWLAGVVAIAVLAGRLLEQPGSPEGAGTIAVFPLRVVNGDSSLADLGQGVSEIAAQAFTGEIGPRSIAMGLAIREKEEAESLRQAAVRLGATWYIDGSVIETPSGYQMSASLHETDTDRIYDIDSFSVPADSYQSLARGLANSILLRVTGQEQRYVAYFLGAAYPVTRLWISGMDAYRRGDYYEAERHFHDAIVLDSTIAPIKLGFLLATGWTGQTQLGPLARRLAWQSRNELPARERDYVEALLGGPPTARFSGVTDPRGSIDRWRKYTASWPDDPEGWYELGDRFFHGGAMANIADYLDQAERAFRRALRTDPTLAQAELHLVDVLVEKGVQPGVPGPSPWSLRVELTASADQYFNEIAPEARVHTAEAWRTAIALGDANWLSEIREQMDSMPYHELHELTRSAMAYGWPLEDAERAVGILERTVETRDLLRRAIAQHAYLELNAGRPARMDSAAEEMHKRLPDRPIHHFMRVEAALLGDGDESVAAAAAGELDRIATAPVAPDPMARHDQYVAGFFAETWKLMKGDPDPDAVEATIRGMRRGLDADAETDELLGPLGDFFTTFLDALLAATADQPDALPKALAADSVLLRHWGETAGPWDPGWALEGSGPVLIMRLHQIRGDIERALAAARRRGTGHTAAGSGTTFLSTRLLVEARLATRAGDIEGARRAYTHYLALRADPEPALFGQRDSARAELAALPRDGSAPVP